MCGRRTAGAVFRDELEEILVNLPGLKLIRGTRDACVYYDSSTKLLLLHHVDDVRVAGPKKVRLSFFVELSKRVPLKQGPEEGIGAKIDVLGRSRYRLEDAIVSVPSEKYTDNFLAALDMQDCKSSPVPSKQWDRTEALVALEDPEDAKKYRTAVGNGIYLSRDRNDIKHAVQELARHMQEPRLGDMAQCRLLARYLQGTRHLGNLLQMSDAEKSKTSWSITIYDDSDWAQCPDTRRSTTGEVACVLGCPVEATSQTQPGLPSISVGEAETRASCHGAQTALFLKQLVEEDFGQQTDVPEMYTDNNSNLQNSDKMGVGRVRHIETQYLFVQGAVKAGLLKVKKIDGAKNPSNALTKHLKSGPEHQAARLGLGMIDSSQLSLQSYSQLKIAAVKHKPWFPGPKLVFSAVMASQLLQLVSSEKTGNVPVAVRASTNLATVHITDTWLSLES